MCCTEVTDMNKTIEEMYKSAKVWYSRKYWQYEYMKAEIVKLGLEEKEYENMMRMAAKRVGWGGYKTDCG